MRYKIYFYFKGKCKTILTNDMIRIMEGFWLNLDLEDSQVGTPYETTKAYFVPTNQIHLIEDLTSTGGKRR